MSKEITYQGKLTDGANPANGAYDISFDLYNAPVDGAFIDSFTATGVNVDNGLFTTGLTFSNLTFNNTQLWMQIFVRKFGSPLGFIPLATRQKLTAAPAANSLTLPVAESANISGSLLDFRNTSTGSTSRGLVLGIGALSGIGNPFSFPTGLVVDSASGDGIYSLNSTSSGYGIYSRTTGTNSVAIYGQNFGASGNAAIFSTSVATNPSPTVSIANSGVGSSINISQSNVANLATSLSLINQGTGSGIVVTQGNAGATAPAISATTNGNAANQPSSTSTAGLAIKGVSTGNFGVGVFGRGPSAGVYGFSDATGGVGIYGATSGGSGSTSSGVRGDGNGAGTTAVSGFNNLGTALYGQTSSGTAIFASNGQSNVSGFAGDFRGRVQILGNLSVVGNLTKSSGSFKIDHPMDPENKYLSHSFVESPDMMNIYNGTIITDDRGYATITLPAYFESLNVDYRYQLTVIDRVDSADFVQAKVVKPVTANAFMVRTSSPKVEVSWQVTGVRNDAFARTKPITIEADKEPENKGKYLNPAAFGAPSEKGIGHAQPAVRAN